MLDVSVSYNRYKFLGYEFLTWLWFVIDNQPKTIGIGENGSLEIGNRIALENRNHGDVTETIIIKGDDAGLEEGVLSLKKGAMVSEINLSYRWEERIWQFTLKGESFHLTQVKIPEKRSASGVEDIEKIVLEKSDCCEKMFRLIDKLYENFIKTRISERWEKETLPAVRSWING